MYYLGIGLHKISLGALVLALGLLVDDAIIAVEMMAIKMEQGFDRVKAASYAWTSTAFPMLTGTLITAAGFLPIATAQSGTGEYTRSIFQVVTIALLASWVAPWSLCLIWGKNSCRTWRKFTPPNMAPATANPTLMARRSISASDGWWSGACAGAKR